MADISIIKAGIAWAVPVRPDALGRNVQAYKKALPVLKALRLCHRFGKGPKVKITKLPNELILTIEDVILQHFRLNVTPSWESCFRHFEGRCEPVDHLDFPGEIVAEVRDELFEDLCEDCQKVELGDECEQCENMIESHINSRLYEVDPDQDMKCSEEGERWLKMIDQSSGGKFEKYDQLLLKHFGLKAHFSTTRIGSAPWTTDPNHTWHMADELQTTICFLMLPPSMSGKKTYGISEMESECVSGATVPGTQSSIVTIPDFQGQEKRAKQFAHALRTLKLKPYVHPSQLDDTISTMPAPTSNHAANDEGQTTKENRTKELAQMQWPQLVMLVNSELEW